MESDPEHVLPPHPEPEYHDDHYHDDHYDDHHYEPEYYHHDDHHDYHHGSLIDYDLGHYGLDLDLSHYDDHDFAPVSYDYSPLTSGYSSSFGHYWAQTEKKDYYGYGYVSADSSDDEVVYTVTDYV